MHDPIQLNFKYFIKIHFIIPFTLFFLALIVLEFTPLDFHISEQFYNSTLQQWPYKDNWLIQTVLHKGGQAFSKIMGVVVLLFLLASIPKKSPLNHYRTPLMYLFFAAITGPIIIAILKSHTHLYCPWDLQIFGGKLPYIRLLDNVPSHSKIGHCFPAGHAGGGYTFISLYFFLLIVKPTYKKHGLYFGLLLGIVYGVAQQMRGAHFLSHDIFSLAICWFASLGWFLILYRKRFR